MHCPECGSKISSNSNFCEECGKKIEADADNSKFCKYCGKKINAMLKYVQNVECDLRVQFVAILRKL